MGRALSHASAGPQPGVGHWLAVQFRAGQATRCTACPYMPWLTTIHTTRFMGLEAPFEEPPQYCLLRAWPPVGTWTQGCAGVQRRLCRPRKRHLRTWQGVQMNALAEGA